MPRVLLIHTGGTLGMQGSPLEPGEYSAELTETVPEIAQIADVDSHILSNVDSSDMGPTQWTELARLIGNNRDVYDGFVIVHGTDTMAYTASALTWALEGLDKPVVLTGAQRPLAALRTDARRNLADAFELATVDIPEVGICFDGMLLRGCCATKTNTNTYRAFSSPMCQPLARLGVEIELADHVRRPSQPFRSDPRFDHRVVAVTVIPGLSPRLLERILTDEDDVRGVVLLAFGAGTVPREHKPLAPVIADAVDAGIEVLVITQATGHVRLPDYQNSRTLMDAGAVSGGRMLLEAAVTKLMHALAVHETRADRHRYLEWNVAGER